jgi:hypothetical protein
MISDDASLRWNEAHIYHKDKNPQESNWWMNSELHPIKNEIISDIVHNGQDKFFDKSLEFNAMQGGRFNPSRSFGVLYSSSDPLMACLEVLYHQFQNAYPLYKRMNNSSNSFTSSFNMNVPQHLRVVLVAFEMEIDAGYCSREVCCDLEEFKNECKGIGFGRYIGDKFSRDFIFGNDYEIPRILGCYLHSQEDPTYKVPSARVDFETQDLLDIRNYLIPESRYKPELIDLTGNYIEYSAVINLEANEDHGHEVDLQVLGETMELLQFFLQPTPRNNKPKNQHKIYEPNLNDGNDKRRFNRTVELQRFFSKD